MKFSQINNILKRKERIITTSIPILLILVIPLINQSGIGDLIYKDFLLNLRYLMYTITTTFGKLPILLIILCVIPLGELAIIYYEDQKKRRLFIGLIRSLSSFLTILFLLALNPFNLLNPILNIKLLGVYLFFIIGFLVMRFVFYILSFVVITYLSGKE